jgi:hypothetical protein
MVTGRTLRTEVAGIIPKSGHIFSVHRQYYSTYRLYTRDILFSTVPLEVIPECKKTKKALNVKQRYEVPVILLPVQQESHVNVLLVLVPGARYLVSVFRNNALPGMIEGVSVRYNYFAKHGMFRLYSYSYTCPLSTYTLSESRKFFFTILYGIFL